MNSDTLIQVADLTSFFEPLEVYPEEVINTGTRMYSTEVVSILSSLPLFERVWQPGQSIVNCLKLFYNSQQNTLIPLEILIAHVEDNGPIQKLRFEVGDEVECYMGDDRKKGKVQKLWVYPEWVHPESDCLAVKSPYQVLLDDGSKTYAPHDIDQIIRAPQEFPPLRFARGDLVLARTINGWEEGIIHILWQKHPEINRWLPYVIELEGGTMVVAPIDDDDHVRARPDNFAPLAEGE